MNAQGASAEELLGRVLDRKYRLIRLIGKGGMGAVYEAEHILIHRRVAVKILDPLFVSVPESVARFLREAQAAGTIGHPNIIEIQDVGEEEDGTIFIVMELLKGLSLEELLDKEGCVSPKRATVITLQVLAALQAAHEKGILHRDLKPDNIFLSVDARMREEVKLLDFGVAKFQEIEDESLSLTKTGTVLGTPYYLAPEQARGGRNIDERIDVWSAGVVLYEMLTGELPFDGDNYNEVLGKILLEEPVPVQSINPGIPEPLSQVVERALAKDPEERFANVTQMMESLLPFHDPNLSEMSTGAIEVLKLSQDVEEERNGYQNGTKSGGTTRKKRISSRKNGSPSAFQPGFLNGQTNQLKPEKPASKKRMAIGIAAGTAIALLAVLAIFINRESSAEQTSSNRTASPREPDKLKSDVASNQQPTESPKTKSDAALQLADQANDQQNSIVSIELDGLPSEAEVLLDGETASIPLKLHRSTTPVILKIRASGFQDYETAFIPDQDKRLPVEMSKRERNSTKRKSHRKRTKSDKKDKTKDKDGVWAQNPFAG